MFCCDQDPKELGGLPRSRGWSYLAGPQLYTGAAPTNLHMSTPTLPPWLGTLGLFYRGPGQLSQGQLGLGNAGAAGSKWEVKPQKGSGPRKPVHKSLYLSSLASLPAPSLGLKTGQAATPVQGRIQELLAPLPTRQSPRSHSTHCPGQSCPPPSSCIWWASCRPMASRGLAL